MPVIVAIAAVIVALSLCGLSNFYWIARNGYVWAPTPTPTATPRPATTPTQDFRATRFVEDVLTQVAYSVALATQAALAPPTTQVVVVVVTPSPVVGPSPTPTVSTVMLPIISAETAASPTPALVPALPAETAVGPPAPSDQAAISPLPTVAPGDTAAWTPTVPPPLPTEPGAAPPPVETPSPTPTLEPPTPTPLPTAPPPPTFTPAPYTVNTLRSMTRDGVITLMVGPSMRYSETGEVESDVELTLQGRDETGEWVYGCCADVDGQQQPGWVRQAYISIEENDLQPGAPPSATPNDARWLRIQPPLPTLQPLPVATPIPGDDFPLYRYSHSNRARVPLLPSAGLANGWPAVASAANSLTSPVVVMRNDVVVASADNHVYSFDRTAGNQRWRFNLNGLVSAAPAVQDEWLYLVTEGRELIAFRDLGGEPAWRRFLDLPILGGINVAGDNLYVPTGQENDHRVVVVDRFDGDVLRTLPTTGPTPRHVAIGQQLVYIGDGGVWAYDVESDERVWTVGTIGNVLAPPVYVFPGELALAELYVATDTGLYSLDANTGKQLWRYENNTGITGLAVAGPTVYASGDGFVEALARSDHAVLWRASVGGNPLGGPLVDDQRILAVTPAGLIQILDRANGSTVGSATVPTVVRGAPAVSGGWVYVPGDNGQLYAYRVN